MWTSFVIVTSFHKKNNAGSYWEYISSEYFKRFHKSHFTYFFTSLTRHDCAIAHLSFHCFDICSCCCEKSKQQKFGTCHTYSRNLCFTILHGWWRQPEASLNTTFAGPSNGFPLMGLEFPVRTLKLFPLWIMIPYPRIQNAVILLKFNSGYAQWKFFANFCPKMQYFLTLICSKLRNLIPENFASPPYKKGAKSSEVINGRHANTNY